MAPPIQITEKKLILTEGRDTYYFCIWAYQAFNTTGIQVLDFGGIKDLNIYLKNLTLLSFTLLINKIKNLPAFFLRR